MYVIYLFTSQWSINIPVHYGILIYYWQVFKPCPNLQYTSIKYTNIIYGNGVFNTFWNNYAMYVSIVSWFNMSFINFYIFEPRSLNTNTQFIPALFQLVDPSWICLTVFSLFSVMFGGWEVNVLYTLFMLLPILMQMSMWIMTPPPPPLGNQKISYK